MPLKLPRALTSFVLQLGKVDITTYLTGADTKTQENLMAGPR